MDAVIASFDRIPDYGKLQSPSTPSGRRPLLYERRPLLSRARRGSPTPRRWCRRGSLYRRHRRAVVGVPSRYMAEAILALVDAPPERCLMIGDRLETDVLLGLNNSMDAALVLTGATSRRTRCAPHCAHLRARKPGRSAACCPSGAYQTEPERNRSPPESD